MGGTDPQSPRGPRARGLESVVRLYLSRPSKRADAKAPLQTEEERAETTDIEHRAAADATLEFERASEPGPAGDELPPLEDDDEAPGPGEEHLPPLRLGEEARHAEAAFQIEETLLEEGSGEPPAAEARDAAPPNARDADPAEAQQPAPAVPPRLVAPPQELPKGPIEDRRRTKRDAIDSTRYPLIPSGPSAEPDADIDEYGSLLKSAESDPLESARGPSSATASPEPGETPAAGSLRKDLGHEIEIRFVEETGAGSADRQQAARPPLPELRGVPDESLESESAALASPLAPSVLPGMAAPESPAAPLVYEAPSVESLPIARTTPGREVRPEAAHVAVPPLASAIVPASPRVVLVVGAAPEHIRGLLLDALARPVADEGRRVMILETEPRLDGESELYEESLGLDTPVFRRGFGKSSREVLLLPPEERRAIFGRIAAAEKSSQLVLVDLELPESILCLRLQFLVDAVVVALTSRESSLYEAYRALRGLSDRRPGMAPFVVPIARAEEEAQVLCDRFRGIAHDFLKIPVREGGWVALPSRGGPSGEADELLSGFSGAPAALAPSLEEFLQGRALVPPSEQTALRELDRPLFDQLGDWFGPALL